MMTKPFKRNIVIYDSMIEQAIHEVDLALIDYEYHGETTKAQGTRAAWAIVVLKTLANHCHYKHYEAIEKYDNEGWLQQQIIKTSRRTKT